MAISHIGNNEDINLGIKIPTIENILIIPVNNTVKNKII